ncbi:MAG: ATP phosphoribosyltransferase regulatory subunit [Proteobacteria bacterium]|nr:ATP phosphoribosyltransferase regulatory subunit [Pseudomonadota bacterium]HQR02898.1 ATP phosphoribosyltransferase regulatory subunit [Rhodocyclaceae bacterium]
MNRWLLPEAIEDILPAQARRVETLRRALLDIFAGHGYELVIPPLLEHVESLLTGSGHDLDLRTFKLVDQTSGRTLGLRADITPQVARIDAHLLNRRGVARLCYCGTVLHTLPAGFNATREPLQLGAEIYGHAGIEADIEIVRLLAEVLHHAGLVTSRIDLGHVGLFRTLVKMAGVGAEAGMEIFAALQAKDVSTLEILLSGAPEPARGALLALPDLYGGVEVLVRARQVLPAGVTAHLDDLERLASALGDLPISFDLSELRGYHYHSGIVFAAYGEGSPSALALGGRYDLVGEAFGCARPATGFSLDLRELADLAILPAAGAILAPWSGDDQLYAEILRLRAAGEAVVMALPGHAGTWAEAGCDRQLVRHGGQWVIEALLS